MSLRTARRSEAEPDRHGRPGGVTTTREDGLPTVLESPDGRTNVALKGSQMVVTNDKGESTTLPQPITPEILTRIDLPIYPGAEADGYMGPPANMLTASFRSKDSCEALSPTGTRGSWALDGRGARCPPGGESACFRSKDGCSSVVIRSLKRGACIILTRSFLQGSGPTAAGPG